MTDPTAHVARELLAAAKDIAGSDPEALDLVLQQQPSFKGKSLAEVAREGRLPAALAYLESISSGFVG
ncbi:MAG: hypothetical protein KGR99_08385 [Betaproteobacteria bacterium]|nr:hypothetical protein [Betaproteobacteria bacterium]MBU6512315.1 hypothetical protein [Betaproteobacteria bacterium]MDE2152395.1 hypothetical protein [Betaproteobacteria bacterium]